VKKPYYDAHGELAQIKYSQSNKKKKNQANQGVALTSFNSFLISDSWWSIASTLFPQSPRKPVWKREHMQNLG
jgi:hypothetical protein